ncbi:MAG: hypothetical protein KGD73_11180 [Candidatus Lokiarchaeota archaeon]|nr:hypothetical protein [Candidatus Lokiarchaeota archaeon]
MGRIKPSEELRDLVYKCTECGNCAIACKFLGNLEPLEIIMRLREKLVKAGFGPMPKQEEYIQSVKDFNNPYKEPHENRTDWLPKDIKIDSNAKVLYYIGCTSSYRRKEMAIAAARIMNEARIPFNILYDEEFCCGSPILRTGELDTFKQVLNRNLDVIESKEIETIVFSCAGCYDTFKVDYPLYRNYNFEVLHTVEFFDKLLENGKIKLTEKIPIKVTYHDPCHLGRNAERYEEWDGEEVHIMPLITMNIPPKPKRTGKRGIYDPPRNILKKIPGLKLVEMERIREYAYCCGAGGGVKSAFPEMALDTAKLRIEEAEDTGAEVIVSACPFCSTNLQDGINSRGSNLKYYDISELLLMAMGLEPEKLKHILSEVD